MKRFLAKTQIPVVGILFTWPPVRWCLLFVLVACSLSCARNGFTLFPGTCNVDEDCDPKQKCIDLVCVANAAGVDASFVDASSEDASRDDASDEDALRVDASGSDALNGDALSGDAMREDASRGDALSDASLGDASRGDALSDAAREDTSSGDAAREDASSGDKSSGDATRGDAWSGDAWSGDAWSGDAWSGDASSGTDRSVLCQGLHGGVHAATQVNGNTRIELDGTQLAGVFTSSVCDGTVTTRWFTLDVSPLAPYNKELTPVSETGYTQGNLDATDLLGLWHLNESTAFDLDTLVDSSGNGNDGTVESQDALDKMTSGVFFSGIHFDGVDDFLGFGQDAGITDLTRFSMVAWVSPDQPGPGAYLLSKADTAAGWSTYIDSSYGVGVNRRNPGVYTQRRTNPNLIVSGAWQHIAATWSGTTGAASIHIYRQAVEPSYSVSTDGSPVVSDASLPLRFGAMTNNTNRFSGQLDELAFWGRVLSPGEVLDIYKRGALRMLYHVRSCDDPLCDTETFIGPDGTASTYYSELMNTSSGPPVFNLSNVVDNRYFQWRAYLETDDPDHSPELIDVAVEGMTVQ